MKKIKQNKERAKKERQKATENYHFGKTLKWVVLFRLALKFS